MGKRPAAFYASLCGGALVLALSLFGFSGLLGRPAIPWDALSGATGLAPESVRRAVVRVDGFEVRDRDTDFKFVTAVHRAGDPVEFVVVTDGRERTLREPLTRFYAGGRFPAIYLLTGLLGFAIGFAVFALRPGDPRARLFFWLCAAFCSAVTVNGEWYGVQGRALHLLPGVLFFFAYTLTPVLLLKFAMSFGSRRPPAERLLWGIALLFAAFFSAVFVAAVVARSPEIFRLKVHFSVFRVFFVLLVLASVAVLYRAYRAASGREARDQVRWVLYGVVAGLGPFLVLYQTPRALGLPSIVSEEVASAFFVLLAPALALAILKYRLLDVHVVVNKSVVYSLLTAVTVGVYLLSIEGLQRVFATGSRPGPRWTAVGAAFIAALAFAPARARIQALVDRAFFRRGYDRRRVVRDFAKAAAAVHRAGDLAALFTDTLAEALPVEKVGLLFPDPGGAAAGTGLRSGIDERAAAALLAEPAGAPGPPARPEIERAGFALALPVPAGDGWPSGWALVGRKRSGREFTEEDRDLLEGLADEAAEALRRIRLHEEVAYERASREKSEELGRLKTEFIAAVSHELRTPVTSLQSVSELLRSGRVADPAKRERLLELMAGECGRLGRFLHNVLDFGRIEQDAKRYEIRDIDLESVVRGAAEIAGAAWAGDGLELAVETPGRPVRAAADPDAVRQALFNLIDNAVKYSAGPKRVTLRLAETGRGAEISVADRGIGIAPENRARIFEAFYRSPEAVRHDPKGVGLGLMIVRHIMDAHGGAIGLDGGPGRGTTVVLTFPRGGKP